LTDDAYARLCGAIRAAWRCDDEPDTRPIERPNLLADPIAQRLMNLLGGTDLKRHECATLLRRLADWYLPVRAKSCQHCQSPNYRRGFYCSDRCKHAAYRARRNRR